MWAEINKKLFTVDEYYRMVDAGVLHEGDRVELIEGKVVQMSPIGNKHAACVDRAAELFIMAFAGRAIVSVQHPLRLNLYNEPQPDLIVLRRREDYYASRSKTPEDAYFVVEVSDTTLRYDTRVKLPLYARAGVSELWIENLQDGVLLICRDPHAGGYKTQLSLRRGDAVSPLAFPDVIFKVEDLLGPQSDLASI